MMMNTIVVPPEKLSYTFQCHHASVRYILAGMYADAIHSIIQGLLAIEVTLIHDDDNDNDYDGDGYNDDDEQMLEEDGTSSSSSSSLSQQQQQEEEDPNKSPTSVDCKEMNHNNGTIHLDRNPMDPSFLWCRNPPPELLLIALLYNLGLAYHLYAIILDKEEENNDDEEFKQQQQDPASSNNNTRAAALQDALKLYHATEKRLKSLESTDYSSYMRPTLRENMRHAVLSYYGYDNRRRRRCNNNNHLCNVTTTTTL